MEYHKDWYLYNHRGYVTCELIYSLCLKLFRNRRKFPLLTMTEFERIKEIAKTAYPENLHQICEIESEEDILGFCHCYGMEQIYYLLENDWYVIVAAHHNCYEIMEYAAATGRCTDILKVSNYIRDNFSRKPIISDSRGSTSFPLYEMLEKKGRIRILNDYKRERDDEVMHYVKLRGNKKWRKGPAHALKKKLRRLVNF